MSKFVVVPRFYCDQPIKDMLSLSVNLFALFLVKLRPKQLTSTKYTEFTSN